MIGSRRSVLTSTNRKYALQLGSAQDQNAWSEGNQWTINSFFSRVNYTFANKYVIEGTIRADGSSRFDPDHRWGWFPGVNVAWRVGEEGFMKRLGWFEDLKVRASYGEMGNQSGIGLYDYIQLISLSNDYYPFGDWRERTNGYVWKYYFYLSYMGDDPDNQCGI